MAKFYGSAVKTGKLGGSVFSIRNGEVIERQYQPQVANPNTEAQVEARAKLKLMSQLSAVMAPVIAMQRVGSVSSRNMFVKENYPATTYSNNQAGIDLLSVKLTKSVVSMPGIGAERSENRILAYISQTGRVGTLDVNRVVYVMFMQQADNTVRLVSSAVATVAGTNGEWPVDLPPTNNAGVIYAYGVRDNSELARATFGNMTVPSAETLAKLIVSRTLTNADVTLTETVSRRLSSAE